MTSHDLPLPGDWPDALRRHVKEKVLPVVGGSFPLIFGDTTVPNLSGHRIAFACRHLRYSGSTRVLIEQMAALGETGVEVMIVCFEDGADEAVLEEIHRRARAVRAIVRGDRKLRALRSVWRSIGPFRPDYWICTDTSAPFVMAEKIARLRIFSPLRMAAVLHEEYDRYLRILEPWRRHIEAFLLDYDFRTIVQEHFGASISTEVIAPLFPLSVRDQGLEQLRDRLRQAHGIPKEAKVLGYAGRLGPNKRIEAMLDVLADLIGEGRDNVWLLLAGDWELESYRQFIDERLGEVCVRTDNGRLLLKDRVRWIGSRRDLSEVYAAMDVFLLFSKAEGFYPLSVLEAQRLKRPVVCTAAGGLSRVLLDGATGFLIPGKATSAGVEWSEESRAVALDRVRRVLDRWEEAESLGANGKRVAEWLTTVYPFGALFRQWAAKRLKGVGTR